MQDDPHIPVQLRQALKDRLAAPVAVPSGFDAPLLILARAHLRRRRWPGRAVAVASGVAAAVLIYAGIIGFAKSPDTRLAMDINHDRQINILDALASARRGDAPHAAIIASQVVRLEVSQ